MAELGPQQLVAVVAGLAPGQSLARAVARNQAKGSTLLPPGSAQSRGAKIMTTSDNTLAPATATATASPKPVGPQAGHPGVWRALSFLLVGVTAIVLVVWIVGSRASSKEASSNRRLLDTESTIISVRDQMLPSEPSISVLGIDRRLSTPIGLESLEIAIPTRVSTLIALRDGDDNIHGLALVAAGSSRDQVTISPTSTARALLALSPRILTSALLADGENLERTLQDIESNPSFESLVAAIKATPIITGDNQQVEAGVASILDRVQRRALADQGCDSVLNPAARAVAGTCVEPNNSGAVASNEQDRWALAFAGPSPWTTLCAAMAPTLTTGSQQSLTTDTCGNQALIAATGPLATADRNDAAIVNRVALATGVQLYADYGAPMMDLAGGSAGLNRPDNAHIFDSLDELVDSTSALIGQESGFESALRVLGQTSTASERHAATVAATRTLVNSAAAFSPGWEPEASTVGDLLDFYDRVGERMATTDRTHSRWTAPGSGVVELGTNG